MATPTFEHYTVFPISLWPVSTKQISLTVRWEGVGKKLDNPELMVLPEVMFLPEIMILPEMIILPEMTILPEVWRVLPA